MFHAAIEINRPAAAIPMDYVAHVMVVASQAFSHPGDAMDAAKVFAERANRRVGAERYVPTFQQDDAED